VGVGISGSNAPSLLKDIEKAERAGLDAAWVTSGGLVPDPLAVLAAAATTTTSIALGTSIVPFLPRHPLALWQSALGVQQLSHGRLRLGIGPSTRRVATQSLGLQWPDPHAALAEYLSILRQLAETGRADFAGAYYQVRDRSEAVDLPLYVAALRHRAFELAAAHADGAISWVAPWRHLQREALPALHATQASARLVVHVPIALGADRDSAHSAFRRQLGIYPRIAEYRRLFHDLGYANPDGLYEPALMDELVLWGNDADVMARMNTLLTAGADELLVTMLDVGKGVDGIREILGTYCQHFD